MAVWSSLKDLLFVVYGKNAAIGEHLKQKIIQSKDNNAIRPGTQSITMKDLIVKFGFKVRPVSMSKEEISKTLFGKMKTLNKIIDKIPFDDEA